MRVYMLSLPHKFLQIAPLAEFSSYLSFQFSLNIFACSYKIKFLAIKVDLLVASPKEKQACRVVILTQRSLTVTRIPVFTQQHNQ